MVNNLQCSIVHVSVNTVSDGAQTKVGHGMPIYGYATLSKNGFSFESLYVHSGRDYFVHLNYSSQYYFFVNGTFISNPYI